METVRIISSNFINSAVEIAYQADDGTRKELRIPMADFMLITRKTQEQVLDHAEGRTRSPANNSAKPLSVVTPRSFAVLQQFGTEDPVLLFDCGGLGSLPVRIPRSSVPAVLQQLAPYTSPAAPGPAN